MKDLHVALERDGGFAALPGLARPLALEAAALAPGLREELQRLVDAALAEPAAKPARTRPDACTYHLHIRHADGARTLEAFDPSVPPAFAALAAFTRKHGSR